MSRFHTVIAIFLVLHFGGMIVFVATVDHVGCGLPYMEQPDWCFSAKTGAGLWEAYVLYLGVRGILSLLS